MARRVLEAAALAVLAAVAWQAPLAAAHGFMSMPASRNYIHSTYYPRTQAERNAKDESYWNYCPHCLAGGGPGQVSDGGALTWPVGVAGFCGDMYYLNGQKPTIDTQRDHEAGGRYATGVLCGCRMAPEKPVGLHLRAVAFPSGPSAPCAPSPVCSAHLLLLLWPLPFIHTCWYRQYMTCQPSDAV